MGLPMASSKPAEDKENQGESSAQPPKKPEDPQPAQEATQPSVAERTERSRTTVPYIPPHLRIPPPSHAHRPLDVSSSARRSNNGDSERRENENRRRSTRQPEQNRERNQAHSHHPASSNQTSIGQRAQNSAQRPSTRIELQLPIRITNPLGGIGRSEPFHRHRVPSEQTDSSVSSPRSPSRDGSTSENSSSAASSYGTPSHILSEVHFRNRLFTPETYYAPSIHPAHIAIEGPKFTHAACPHSSRCDDCGRLIEPHLDVVIVSVAAVCRGDGIDLTEAHAAVSVHSESAFNRRLDIRHLVNYVPTAHLYAGIAGALTALTIRVEDLRANSDVTSLVIRTDSHALIHGITVKIPLWKSMGLRGPPAHPRTEFDGESARLLWILERVVQEIENTGAQVLFWQVPAVEVSAAVELARDGIMV